MPASLISLKIRGVRSYSPLETKTQLIEFMPLTLIVGANGSGKTTVIESLKFIISGEEPPLSDSRRNFIHSSSSQTSSFEKQDSRKSLASIQLDFRSSKNDFCTAIRDISLLRTNSTPTVSSCYRVKDGPLKHVHKQDDWNKTIPSLFNIPNQALLNNVILCHQEQNLWCMADSSSVKLVFDKIFGCERYKREIKHIEAEIKACKTELVLSEKDMINHKERVVSKRALEDQFLDLKGCFNQLGVKVHKLEADIISIVMHKQQVAEELQVTENRTRQLVLLKNQLNELSKSESSLKETLITPMIRRQSMSDVDLLEHLDSHTKLVDEMQRKQEYCKMQQQQLISKLEPLSAKKLKLSNEINTCKVLELKFKETRKNLETLLQDIQMQYQLENLRLDDTEASIESLENYEKTLMQSKSEQAQLEDDLSTKGQHLSENISNLEGQLQGLAHKISNKEILISKLKNQLAENDPIAEQLNNVTENFGKMCLLTTKMDKTEQLDSLVNLIEQSKSIVEKLLERIRKEGGRRINNEINKEKWEIKDSNVLLLDTQKKREEISLKKKQLQDDYFKVRKASKEAHNRVVTFSNTRNSVTLAIENFRREEHLLDTMNIDDLERRLTTTVEKIDKLNTDLNNVQNELTSYPTSLKESYQQHEQFKINIQLRKMLDQVEAKKNEIALLIVEAKDDEIKLLELQKKFKNLEKEEQKLRDDQSKSLGSRNELKRSIERLEKDLKNHSNSDRNYSQSLGKVVCNSIIINDLSKLKECFQQSIVTFHNQMIVKINEVLRLRWKQIYQGSDIDCIQLVDEEIVKGKDKRTYNYYIAMLKGGITMKMREKSSAGQKALASIILRMTLAELFVKDFAFIALDEPTANLDLANVQSLASAIGIYVKKRTRNNTNIQWIIITHDESFLKALDAECSPYYYKIQLNSDGCSHISRVSSQEWQPSSSSAPSTQ